MVGIIRKRVWGAYTRSNTSVTEKVGLSVGGLIRGGLIGGEIRYLHCRDLVGFHNAHDLSLGMSL